MINKLALREPSWRLSFREVMGNRKPRRGDGCRARGPCVPESPGPEAAPIHTPKTTLASAQTRAAPFPHPSPRRTCALGSPAQAGPTPEVTPGAGPGSGVPSRVVSANSGWGRPRVPGPGFTASPQRAWAGSGGPETPSGRGPECETLPPGRCSVPAVARGCTEQRERARA